MLEKHENEQYFFAPDTVRTLADIAGRFERPCCLCAPLIGQELERRGSDVVTLDCDERFSHLKGFRRFDLFRPAWQGDGFGVILCDPPFFKCSLSQLFGAIRILSRHNYEQPLLVCYLTRREANVIGTFAKFGLRPAGFFPEYVTVKNLERNEIQCYANFDLD